MKLWLNLFVLLFSSCAFAQSLESVEGVYRFEGKSGAINTSYVLTINKNSHIKLSQVFSQKLGAKVNILMSLQCEGVGAISKLGALSTKVTCNDGKTGEQYIDLSKVLNSETKLNSVVEIYNSFLGQKQQVLLK